MKRLNLKKLNLNKLNVKIPMQLIAMVLVTILALSSVFGIMTYNIDSAREIWRKDLSSPLK